MYNLLLIPIFNAIAMIFIPLFYVFAFIDVVLLAVWLWKQLKK